MLNLSLTRRFWNIFCTLWLRKISIWSLYYHHILAAGKLRSTDSNKTYNNAINVRISLNRYGSKIRKVSRWRPIVSEETILETKQEFFFTKVAPVQGITYIALLGFWLILFPWMFILSYTTIYFFVKNFLFDFSYFSEYYVPKFLFVFWLRNRPSIKYLRNWGNRGGSSRTCTDKYRRRS